VSRSGPEIVREHADVVAAHTCLGQGAEERRVTEEDGDGPVVDPVQGFAPGRAGARLRHLGDDALARALQNV
jgi:hypothetical protein